MAKLSIKIRAHLDHALTALADAADTWPQSKRDECNAEWRRMQAAGAETIDSQMIDGALVVYPSPDFTAHLSKWGVHLG